MQVLCYAKFCMKHGSRPFAKKVLFVAQSKFFIEQLDADDGNLSLLLREAYTGSASYKNAVERQLNYFQQELKDDLIRLERLNNSKLFHPELVSMAITQLVFNMGAKVIDMPSVERKKMAEQTMIMIRMILEGSRHLDEAMIR